MRFFENLSIKGKLFAGFGVVIVITMVVAIIGINRLQTTAAKSLQGIKANNSQIEIMTDIRAQFLTARLTSRDILLNIDDASVVSSTVRSVSNLHNEIADSIQSYKNLIKNSDTSSYTVVSESEVTNLLSIIDTYFSAISNVESLATNGKIDEAVSVFYQNTGLAASVSNMLVDFRSRALDSSAKMLEDNTEDADTSTYVLIFITVVAVLLGILMVTLISASIIIPMKKLQDIAIKTAAGDFSENAASNRRDEIGQLSNSFAQIVSVADALERELEIMDQKITIEGDVDYKMDETRFSGGYKSICQHANGLIGQLINEILDIIDSLDCYAHGRFDKALKVYPGKKVVLNNALDALRYNIRDVAKGVTDAANAASEGNLSYPIDVNKYSGEWQNLIKALNTLMSNVRTPIEETVSALGKMSQGSLNVSVSGDYKGDFAKLKTSINATARTISGYISEITDTLQSMSAKDLTPNISGEYVGDFAPIKTSLNRVLEAFNMILAEMGQSAEQVATGARSIAESSMMLAQGASEQAESVDDLTITFDTVNNQTTQNAKNAENANRLATSAKADADAGNEEMRQMLAAMSEINEASQNISRIIKVIEDIALQTNLLALNAAVEAAHAGSHGKGFTVVADQVRNLAVRSQEAAKQTTTLIEGTVEKVSEGMTIADRTAITLQKIVGQIAEISQLVDGVAVSSTLQANAITEVNSAIGQIAQVTQTNSASSEEGASSSQELSSQAEVFRSVVSEFKLKGAKQVKPTSKSPAKKFEPVKAEPAKFEPVKPELAKFEPIKKSATPFAPKPDVKPKKAETPINVQHGTNNATFYSSYDSPDFGKYN